jgi:hypothetical protein
MITSSRQARQMLGRLAGLKSARKQRQLDWPNLRRATAMRRLRCRFRRCAEDAWLSPNERGESWRRLMALGVERASALDMLVWMKRCQPREEPGRLDLHALARARFQLELTNSARQQKAETKGSGCLRGMTLADARRRGLIRTCTSSR